MAKANQVVALFVDVNNLYHNCFKRFEGRRLDYKKLIDAVGNDYGRLQVALAYGVATDQNVESFKALLRHSGYECRWANSKYNWNVGITVDVIRQLDKVDLVILGSGDPYLAPCAEYVRNQGIKCYSYGFGIAAEMKKSVDRWFEINEDLLIGESNAD